MNKIDKLTGEILKIKREEANLTQTDVSKRFGRGRTWISNFENGIRSINWNELKQLCQIYGCSVEEISNYIDDNW